MWSKFGALYAPDPKKKNIVSMFSTGIPWKWGSWREALLGMACLERLDTLSNCRKPLIWVVWCDLSLELCMHQNQQKALCRCTLFNKYPLEMGYLRRGFARRGMYGEALLGVAFLFLSCWLAHCCCICYSFLQSVLTFFPLFCDGCEDCAGPFG